MPKVQFKKVAYSVFLWLMPLLCIILALFVGRYPISFTDVWRTFGSLLNLAEAPSREIVSVILYLRVPRAIAGAFIGASLAVSGAAFQGIFRNPLVNSGILGVSNGAGFGASLAILIMGSGYAIYPSAFIFGALAVFLSWLSGRIYSTTPSVTLILGGVIVSSFFAALTSIVKYLADPYTQLPAITFWLMGSLASIGYKQLFALLPMSIGMGIIYFCRGKINALSMGDKEALALGVNVPFYKFLIIIGATLCTAAAVCISGSIGWVGLVIPHIARMLIGNDNYKLIPLTMSLGACFMVLIDLLARNISGSEIPIGILTAIIGTPFYIYLLKKTKGGGW